MNAYALRILTKRAKLRAVTKMFLKRSLKMRILSLSLARSGSASRDMTASAARGSTQATAMNNIRRFKLKPRTYSGARR
jgi:hypothetical protein